MYDNPAEIGDRKSMSPVIPRTVYYITEPFLPSTTSCSGIQNVTEWNFWKPENLRDRTMRSGLACSLLGNYGGCWGSISFLSRPVVLYKGVLCPWYPDSYVKMSFGMTAESRISFPTWLWWCSDVIYINTCTLVTFIVMYWRRLTCNLCDRTLWLK